MQHLWLVQRQTFCISDTSVSISTAKYDALVPPWQSTPQKRVLPLTVFTTDMGQSIFKMCLPTLLCNITILSYLLLHLRGMLTTRCSLSKGFLCSTRSSLPILKTQLQRLLTLYTSNQGHVTIVVQGDLTPHLWRTEANSMWFKSRSYSNSQSWHFHQSSLVHTWLLQPI